MWNVFSSCAVILWMRALPPGLGAQAMTLTASPAPEHGSFGFAVALDGDYAVVGAPLEEAERGVVYVFFRDPAGGWTQQARLTAGDRKPGDAFGHAVALDGSFLLVGAPTRAAATPGPPICSSTTGIRGGRNRPG